MFLYPADSSKRNENQNEKDHSMFRNILDIFQGRSNCRAVSELSMDDTEYVFEDLKDITNAVTWQS